MGEFICKVSGTYRSLNKYQLPFTLPSAQSRRKFDSTSLTLSANTKASFSQMLPLNRIDSSGSQTDIPCSSGKDANCFPLLGLQATIWVMSSRCQCQTAQDSQVWPSIAPDPTVFRATTQGPQILGDDEEIGLLSWYLGFHFWALSLKQPCKLGQVPYLPWTSQHSFKQILYSRFTHGEIETQRDEIIYSGSHSISVSVWVPVRSQWPIKTE